ncbi:MAG: hypothetical protein HZC28_14970 [Spirochaetes bacterium]|nr:hypothetical protein [Spirochaetota bacterium]
MNQDQTKTLLLKLSDPKEAFTVIFSGKQSDKVHGLYKPETREIIIHNRNFDNDNQLMYTAIHEFAHHVQFTESPVPTYSRAHTGNFWRIFHALLEKAESEGIYRNIFKDTPAFTELSATIRSKFLTGNASLMQEFGEVLIKAHALCEQYRVEFDDYMDRELGFHRSTAKTIMKVSTIKADPAVGFENMKMLARIREPEDRERAEKALLSGKSPDTVRMEYVVKSSSDDKLENLIAEKRRVATTIERLQSRLTTLEREINTLSEKA